MEKCCNWDKGSVWLKDQPCKIYVGHWPIFHGPLILPYIIVIDKLFLYIKRGRRPGVFVPLRGSSFMCSSFHDFFISDLFWKLEFVKQKSSIMFLAHLSQRLIWWAYRIGRPLSSLSSRRRRPHFSSETTGSIKVKFHMELQWDGATMVCSNGPGHMTKMAAMPIYMYGKNLKISSFQEPKGWWPWNASSGAWVLPSLLKWWSWVDLHLFCGEVKYGPL